MDVDEELEEERRRMMADRSRRRASISLASSTSMRDMSQFRASMTAISDGEDEEEEDEEEEEELSDEQEEEEEGEEEEEDIYGNFQSDESDESDDELEDEEHDDDYESHDKDELVYMLRETEQRMQQAAEFGQALLQQTELLKRENSRLTQEREETATQLEENEWRMDELETEKAHLQDMISAQQEEMKAMVERTSVSEEHESETEPQVRERSVSSVQREQAISDEEEYQRKRAIAAERSVKELTASLSDLREREVELLDGKAAELDARVAAEQEAREQKRALGQAQTEVAAKTAEFAELQTQFDSQRDALEKEQRLRGHIETRLGMYAREIRDMKTFLSDPDKKDGVLKRLDLLETKVDHALSSGGAVDAVAATAQLPKRDLTVMVTKSDLVQAAGRSKFSVSTIEELEAELIKKLQLSVAAIAIHSWDAELGTYIHAADLSDLSDRPKVQLQEREKLEEEARELAKAEVAAIVSNTEEAELVEPEDTEEHQPSSEEDAKLIESLRKEVESLSSKLRTSRKEVTRLRKAQAAQEKEAKEMLAGEFEKKERAHRNKIIKMKEISRRKKLTRECFQRWYQLTAGDKLSKLQAAQAEAQAAVEAAKGLSAADLEAAEKRAAEMAELMAAQEKRLLAERSVAAAASITREVMIRSVELRGEHDVVGEDGSSFSICRLEVIGSGGGKGMMTWEVARRYSDFSRLRKALTNTKEVSRLKSKKLINNGGVEEKFPTRYSKGNMRSKVKGGEKPEMLAAWLAAVIEKYAQVGVVREFLTDDGSANIIADLQVVREKLLADGAKIEGSSLSAKIGSCTLVRSLTTTDGQIGCRSPNEKSTFLVCVSRSIASDSPRPRDPTATGDDNTQKKFYVLSTLTPPSVHGTLSVPGIASPSVIRQLDQFCSGLGHPYVHRVQDITSSTDIYGKPKVLVLRDNVVRGSIRDLLMSETNPLRTFKEKYGGRTRVDMKAGAPLELPRLLLLAKQVLTAMCFLESIGLPTGHVHAGNVVVISDSRLVGDMESIAVTDFENSLLQLPHTHTASGAEETAPGAGTPDETEAGAVCAFGCLLYEMSTGCQWERSMAHIDSCPQSIRPIVERCLALAPVTPRAGTGADSTEQDQDTISLQSLLASEPFGSVALSEMHTSAFPTADELPVLQQQCEALRKALAEQPSLEPDVPVEAATPEGVPPDSGRTRQVSSFKEQEDYEIELSDEVEKLLVSCCEDSTAKPPADAVERLRRVASLPTGGVLAPWLAQRLGEGLESSTPVVVKTLQLIGKLVPTASAQFKRRLKAETASQVAAAKSYDKLDEKYGDKPAKMVQKLATGLEGALMGS